MGRPLRRLSPRQLGIVLAALAATALFALPSLVAVEAPKRSLSIGLNLGDTLFRASPPTVDRALDDSVTLGVKWIRVDISWTDIQPDGPTSYEWTGMDRVIQGARTRGLKVLATLGFTPPWAWPQGCGDSGCPPADPVTFAAFARTAALRYAPLGVHTWEIWNEPNLSGAWQPAPDPGAYTTRLRDTSRALRQVDPASFLLLGGLAAVPTGSIGISQTDFLAAVSRLGGNHLVNAVGYHPYNFPRLYSTKTVFGTPWERIDSWQTNLVAILAAYGTPKLPVWVTEAGAPTGGPGSVTEQRQAQIATDAVATAYADTHVGALFWYDYQDNPIAKDYFGLRHADGSAKPAFNAFRDALAAELR